LNTLEALLATRTAAEALRSVDPHAQMSPCSVAVMNCEAVPAGDDGTVDGDCAEGDEDDDGDEEEEEADEGIRN
jgi:hypothetical protein